MSYVLKFDEEGRQCLYDGREERKLICGDIYDILDYVKAHGGGTIYVKNTIHVKGVIADGRLGLG